MEEKKYLKWYNKIGYGSGDIAGNVVYAFLTSFMMVYLTDSVGLAAGVVGTLIAVSKLFDGFTDIFFGSMIDKTHSKMGKAKPWMLYGYIGLSLIHIYKRKIRGAAQMGNHTNFHQSADHAAENARPDRKAPFGRTDCGKF